jgi:hypothetical protein
VCPLEIPYKERSRLRKAYEISPESVDMPPLRGSLTLSKENKK